MDDLRVFPARRTLVQTAGYFGEGGFLMNILTIKKLVKAFGGVNAVNGASFEVTGGKITALIGPNGAGKTTVFNLISGLIKPDAGQVQFIHNDITGWFAHHIAKQGISRTFQLSRVFKQMSVADNLRLAKPSTDQELEIALHTVGLEKQVLSKLAGELSYGQQRLMEIARALLFPHKLLMLDEPTAGVNPAVRKQLKGILREAKSHGSTILLIEHDMDFVMDVSDHVIVLAEGKVLCEGRPAKVRKDKRVLEAYLGK